MTHKRPDIIATSAPRKVYPLPGGVHPPENKAQSLQVPIVPLPAPERVILPLNQHIGEPASPTIAVGDRVLTGQPIAQAQGRISAPVHASISGTVTAIEARAVPHASGLTATCVVIESDGKDEWIELTPCEAPLQADNHTLLEKIRSAGIAGLGGAGFPAATKLQPRADHPISQLIINASECEPYITADDSLMQERAEEIVGGIQILAKLLNQPADILIGIEDNKPNAINALQAASLNTPIDVVVIPTKYPSGGEKQLIYILTGKEVPSGSLPSNLGIVVQNVGTAHAVYRAVRYGEPLIRRITTVVGKALKEERNVEVRLGTPVEDLLDLHGFDRQQAAQCIMGGPMMGFALPSLQVPVVKTTNCLLVPSHDEMPPAPDAAACIRCGLCSEACPAGLLPQQLYWYARSDDHDKLEAHNLFDCIECGACSFVCPSRIPLVQYYRAAKGTIRQERVNKEKADRSRQRFEFRQTRIAKAEAEKAAKRLARQKAAEELKAKKALEAANQPPADIGTTATPASAKAEAPSTTAKAAPKRAPNPARLQRSLSSAEDRLQKAKQRLADNTDDERVGTLEAQVKQMEVAVEMAKQKLADAEAALAQNAQRAAPEPSTPQATASQNPPIKEL